MLDLLNDPFFARNFTYGVQDSLISTSGVVLGVSFAKFTNKNILITGYILILVEALSMAYGSFISEDAFMKTANMKFTEVSIIKYALTMFFSYSLAGLIPMIPFIFNFNQPWKYSIIFTITTLSLLIYTFQHNFKKTLQQTIYGIIILFLSLYIGKGIKHKI